MKQMSNFFRFFFLFAVTTFFLPTVSFASSDFDFTGAGDSFLGLGCPITDIFGLVCRITAIIRLLLPFIIALAILVILWGILIYLTQAGSEEKRKEAIGYVVWGIISLFVMVSIWGLVNVLIFTFNFERHLSPRLVPTVPTIQGRESAEDFWLTTDDPPATGDGRRAR